MVVASKFLHYQTFDRYRDANAVSELLAKHKMNVSTFLTKYRCLPWRWRGLLAKYHLLLGAVMLAFIVAVASPLYAQQPTSVDPDASAVHERQLLQEPK